MKVEAVTLYFKPNVTSLDGTTFRSFSEADEYIDLHYIVRDGLHVVNYTDPCTGNRHGVSLPISDVRQVNTVL